MILIGDVNHREDPRTANQPTDRESTASRSQNLPVSDREGGAETGQPLVAETQVAEAAAAQLAETPAADPVPSNDLSRPETATRFDQLPLPGNLAFDVIGRRFLSETRDPAWSPNMELRILERIAESQTDSGFVSIDTECRSTLCRVSLSFAGQKHPDLLGMFSVSATMHGYRLRQSIEQDLDLETLMFDSGIVYGTPMSLLYLRRTTESAAERQPVTTISH